MLPSCGLLMQSSSYVSTPETRFSEKCNSKSNHFRFFPELEAVLDWEKKSFLGHSQLQVLRTVQTCDLVLTSISGDLASNPSLSQEFWWVPS